MLSRLVSPDRTFILGIGAQKCGTSWLAHYLRNHPSVAMSAPKELHYFDTKWRPDIAGPAPDFVREIISDGRPYFDTLARPIASGRPYFGEITPSYSVLPADAFAEIRHLHPNTRVIFLMRDPVARFQSGLGHDLARGRRAGFDWAITAPRHAERTRYDRTIVNLLAAFSRDEVFFGFYETLFADSTMRNLCRFLGLEYLPADFATPRNKAKAHFALEADQIAVAREVFDPVYVFCRKMFGDRVPAAWRP